VNAPPPGGASGLPVVIGARQGGLWAAGVLGATGLLFVWQASMLDLGHVGLPGPGFFPLALGVLLTAFSFVVSVGCWRASAASELVELGHPPVMIAFVALLMVPLLFELLGAYLTLGLLSMSLLVFIARLSPLVSGVWTAVGLAACWYLFQELLGLRLPLGPFS
jgi:hypothetical protein